MSVYICKKSHMQSKMKCKIRWLSRAALMEEKKIKVGTHICKKSHIQSRIKSKNNAH